MEGWDEKIWNSVISLVKDRYYYVQFRVYWPWSPRMIHFFCSNFIKTWNKNIIHATVSYSGGWYTVKAMDVANGVVSSSTWSVSLLKGTLFVLFHFCYTHQKSKKIHVILITSIIHKANPILTWRKLSLYFVWPVSVIQTTFSIDESVYFPVCPLHILCGVYFREGQTSLNNTRCLMMFNIKSFLRLMKMVWNNFLVN